VHVSNVTTGYVGSIDNATLQNAYFRRLLFTGPHRQRAVMCIEPGEVELVLNEMDPHNWRDDDAIIVPAST
jgi:hypothetical protein